METGGYKKAETFIRDIIKKKGLKPGDRLPTFRQLAKDAKISIATVQRVIAAMVSAGSLVSRVGSGTYISDYRNGVASLIGVIAPFSTPESGNFMSEIFVGIQDGLKAYNAHYLYYAHPNEIRDFSADKLAAELRKIESLNIKGFLIDHFGDDEKIWDFIEKTGLPAVCINNVHPYHKLSCVTLDNYSGGVQAAECFIKNGHCKCGVLTASPVNTSSVQERIAGFIATLRKNGAEFSEKDIIEIIGDKEHNLSRLKNHIQTSGITAFFAINDSVAATAMAQLKADGFKLPDDISFIGFDGSSLCDQIEPRLTSIRQSGVDMGAKASSMLCSMTNGEIPATGEVMEMRLPPKLIEKSSVRKI